MSQNVDNRRIIVEPTTEKATQLVATMFRSILCESVAARGICYAALAGGTTPHALYQMLASYSYEPDEPWGNLEVFFGDERDVPHDHVESNYHMAQRALLDHVPIDLSHVHPMPADAEDLQTAAAMYERVIRQTVPAEGDSLPRFDLILLGMGGDGHTASLFPGTAALEERQKLVIAHFVSVLGRHRMTFTFPLLNAARNVILLVTGDDKAEAVANLLGPAPDVPASRVQPDQGVLYIVLDAPASRKLPH